jgi:RND family efflux transporter MFP subunit
VEQAEADIDRLQALLKNHTRTVRRLQGLLQKQSTAQSELDTAETELTAARAELSAAKARVKDARYQLARTKIGSPIDGVVQQRQVSVGDYVKKGDPLFQIVATDPLRGRLYFPESLAPQVRIGLPVKLWIGDQAQTIEASITGVRPMLNPVNRSLEALVDFANPGAWRPGFSVTAEVTLATREQAVMAPTLSLVRRPAGTVVYRIHAHKAQQQRVELGRRDGDWIEIITGLAAGETLALDGAGFLSDGAVVEVRGETP